MEKVEGFYKFDWIKIIIFSLCLSCWSYILIKSLGNKEITYIVLIYLSKYTENVESFSGLFF